MPGTGGGEEGAVSFFVAGCAVVFFALAGLAFDGGGRVHQEEQTDAVAREAARAACEQIDRNAVLSGHYQLDQGMAKAAATEYVGNAPDMTITSVTFPAAHVCQVTVTSDYRTKLLSLININDLPVSGQGQAKFVYGVTGQEG